MQYITFATESNFDTWNAEMDTLKGFPDGRGTDTYTSVAEGTDGVFCAAIKDQDVAELETMTSPYINVVADAVVADAAVCDD